MNQNLYKPRNRWRNFLLRFILLNQVLFLFLLLSQCSLPSKSKKSKEPQIQIHFISDEYEEIKFIPSSLFESKDLLLILAELSRKEDPSMRFISTNRTEEIMEVNGKSNSWSEGWVVYVNEERVDGVQMKRGLRVGPNDKIEIKYEAVERVFGRPRP
ncbi:hypothetical protein EHQ68_07005 [Leptospira congkakensis]|uniref:DUF4430 domain-containing protein n=1 Tax=Leptospira congkakensis TaxID=2484932 RepID=A0A4Z1A1F6_9LEPT|nr:hypothetical protein [Leptospira congkakensis]TGL87640.1 hypothetical protein EHQ69_16155 [Leptospira congkakensis]TGL89745.1 hypothetical protein EHQ68_07005 [Leptospira congkakensis]TGL95790.1 hypothetical protein EHQ70_11825 [Leptospira congkakensis]